MRPGEAVGSIRGAGAVSVLYGAAGGLTASGGRLFTQVGGAIEASDFFGSALASGDFNHDGVIDLAAGATGEGALGLTEAGAVSILYGSSGGLTATGGRLFIQVSSEVQAGALFGFALATGDVNGDGAADLAVGAAGHNEFAGAVSILYGSAGGLTATDAQLFTQDSPGVHKPVAGVGCARNAPLRRLTSIRDGTAHGGGDSLADPAHGRTNDQPTERRLPAAMMADQRASRTIVRSRREVSREENDQAGDISWCLPASARARRGGLWTRVTSARSSPLAQVDDHSSVGIRSLVRSGQRVR